MRTVWTKSLLGAFAAAALAVGASAVDAQAASHHHHHGTPLITGSQIGGGPAAATGSNYFGGPSASPAISDSAPATTASAERGAPLASAEESCLVRRPVYSDGRIVGHRWINAC